MILAAIDIGSNAIRLQITRVIFHEELATIYKTLEYIRFPLRLGKDAFRTGEITFRSEIKFLNLMMAFRTLIDLYEADDAYGCATSALRDSVNGERIIARAYQKSGLHIDVISGDREAELLNLAVHKDIDNGHYMHIDVGGGSSEINMLSNSQSYARKSFKLGSVRNMQKKDTAATWEAMVNWIDDNKMDPFDAVIATGGNISTLQNLHLRFAKELSSLDQLQARVDEVNGLSFADRISKLGLREDRADVLPFAAEIYLRAIHASACETLKVPDIGLKDGIIEMLIERNR